MARRIKSFEGKSPMALEHQINEYLVAQKQKNRYTQIVALSHEGHEIDGGRSEKYTALITLEIPE